MVVLESGAREPYLLLNKETGYYYVRKFKASRGELFESTKEKTLGKARKARDEMIAEFEGRGRVRARSGRVTITTCSALTLLWCRDEFKAGERRKRTLEHDRSMLPLIRDHFGESFADEIDEAFWANWVRKKGRKLNRTLGDIAKYLSLTLRIAHEQKLIGRKPTITNPDPQNETVRIYTDDELRLFVKHAEPDLKELMMIAITTGMRPHENREVRWDMLTLGKRTVIIALPAWFTKINKGRQFEASPAAAVIYRKRHAKRNGPYVFPAPKDSKVPLSKKTLSRMWFRMLKLARAEGFAGLAKFHWLRHTFATKALLDAELPVQIVSEYQGTSIVTLQRRYLKGDPKRTHAASTAVTLKLDEEE